MTIDKDKQSKIDSAIAGMNKKYGDGSVRILTGNEVVRMPRWNTGIASLDRATGGGWPKGRHIEIYGPESSGKTTVTLHSIAKCQADGGVCAFIDVEHAFDIEYAKALGVDIDSLIFCQPDSAEEALNVVESLIETGAVDLIVVDSVASLVPKAELDADAGAQLPGLQARLMSQAFRKLTGIANKSHTTVIWINQIRMKIGVLFGSPETTAGGNALKFYASIRIDVRKRGQIKDGDEVLANETEIKIIKNKTAPPYRTCNFQIEFGKGVNRTLDILRIASDSGIVNKSGAWYSFNGEKVGQGEDKSVVYLDSNPKVLDEIIKRLNASEDKNGISTRDNDVSGAT